MGFGVGGEPEAERFDSGADSGSEQGGELYIFDAVVALVGRKEAGVGSAGVKIEFVVRRLHLLQDAEGVVGGHVAGLVAAVDLIADEKRLAVAALTGLKHAQAAAAEKPAETGRRPC